MAAPEHILIVRLGAMGDILHVLPAASSLRRSFPESRMTWVVARKWLPLLAGNPTIDNLIPFERSPLEKLHQSWQQLRQLRPDMAIDFQGLIQSALVGRATRPAQFLGWSAKIARERAASLFYSMRVTPTTKHIVDRNLELAAAAGSTEAPGDLWLPQGRAEGELPSGAFVLTHPFAGWTSKQWPLENYGTLARLLKQDGLELVANVPPVRAAEVRQLGREIRIHSSSLEGLIDATRRAAGVLGLDSGPLHLAAALQKPGVALFGPTDPERNGPYQAPITVVRRPGVKTTYRRGTEVDESMKAIPVEEVRRCLVSAIRRVESRR